MSIAYDQLPAGVMPGVSAHTADSLVELQLPLTGILQYVYIYQCNTALRIRPLLAYVVIPPVDYGA